MYEQASKHTKTAWHALSFGTKGLGTTPFRLMHHVHVLGQGTMCSCAVADAQGMPATQSLQQTSCSKVIFLSAPSD